MGSPSLQFRLQHNQSLYMEKSVVRLFLVVVLCLLVPHVVSGDTEVRAPVQSSPPHQSPLSSVFQIETQLEVQGADSAHNSTGIQTYDGPNFVYHQVLYLVNGIIQKMF